MSILLTTKNVMAISIQMPMNFSAGKRFKYSEIIPRRIMVMKKKRSFLLFVIRENILSFDFFSFNYKDENKKECSYSDNFSCSHNFKMFKNNTDQDNRDKKD